MCDAVTAQVRVSGADSSTSRLPTRCLWRRNSGIQHIKRTVDLCRTGPPPSLLPLLCGCCTKKNRNRKSSTAERAGLDFSPLPSIQEIRNWVTLQLRPLYNRTTHTHTHIYVCIYIYIYIYTHTHTHTRVYICVYIYGGIIRGNDNRNIVW